MENENVSNQELDIDGINESEETNAAYLDNVSNDGVGDNDISDDTNESVLVLETEFLEQLVHDEQILINRIEFLILIDLVITALLLWKIVKRRKTA